MRLVYSITGYKDPEQFAWLFSAIADPRDAFILHIDAKSPQTVHDGFRAITDPHNTRFGNVHYLESEPVVWMGQGLVQAEFRAMAKAFETTSDFDYFINLSAQDYPLTSREVRLERLNAQPDANHVALKPLSTLPFHVSRRRFLYSFEWRGRLIKTPFPRLTPSELDISWKGSWWRVLTRPFCAWALTTALREPYMRFLRHVQAPDELIIQNLIMASPFRDTVSGDNQHLVIWPGKSGSPITLTRNDLSMIGASDKLFARKFDHRIDPDPLLQLAKRIGAPTPSSQDNTGPGTRQRADDRSIASSPDPDTEAASNTGSIQQTGSATSGTKDGSQMMSAPRAASPASETPIPGSTSDPEPRDGPTDRPSLTIVN